MSHIAGRVFVFGSANQDLVFGVESLPCPGATVLSESLERGLGGKGANQAAAAAAAGADVVFVGAVGDDAAGTQIVENLGRRGVSTEWVERRQAAPSGLAAVMVDRYGKNQIVVAAGANSELSKETIAAAIEGVLATDVVAVQCEIPVTCVEHIVEAASARGASVLLNLAPPIAVSAASLRRSSILIVNESEARALVAGAVMDDESLAHEVVAVAGTACVVTLGSRGSRYCAPDGTHFAVPAEVVPTVVDTTGAGDTYVGALAAELARGTDIRRAMASASRAAALSVASRGAQQNEERYSKQHRPVLGHQSDGAAGPIELNEEEDSCSRRPSGLQSR